MCVCVLVSVFILTVEELQLDLLSSTVMSSLSYIGEAIAHVGREATAIPPRLRHFFMRHWTNSGNCAKFDEVLVAKTISASKLGESGNERRSDCREAVTCRQHRKYLDLLH